MAKERLKSPRLRLFVALDLPEAVRAGIAVWGREELSDPALRPVREEALHITLAFLGYMPEKAVPRLVEIVEASAAEAPRIELGDPVAKPSPKRARLFALPAESPGSASMQAELQEKLLAERLYQPEKRPFWPHVTVARVRSEGRGSRRPVRIVKRPGPLPPELLQPFSGVRMTLYRSQLKPQGALYTPLAQIELSGNGTAVR
jgi:RNA 2',3'-cyclic 3'-phosphodiesterase